MDQEDALASTMPERASSPYGRLVGRLQAVAQWGSGVMFVLVIGLFLYKITSRYLAHDEPAWTDEVSVVLFVWIVFWANAFLLRDRDQITFDLAYRPLPARAKRVFAIARALLIGGIFLAALPGSLDYLAFLWRERTPVLGLRLDFVYACFGIFMIAVVWRSVAALVGLLRPNWRTRL